MALASMLILDPNSEDIFKNISDVRKQTLTMLREGFYLNSCNESLDCWTDLSEFLDSRLRFLKG